MENIANKTDGVDVLPDFEFNSHKNELQSLVSESGQTLALATTDQLRKAVSTFSRSLTMTDSSGTPNTLTLSRPNSLTDIPAYYDGLTVFFETPNANTGASTVTVNGLASKKVRTTSDTDIVAGDIVDGVMYALEYDSTFDSAAGAFVLKDITSTFSKLWNPKKITHNITVDADYTLTAAQNKNGRIIITDSGVLLTLARNIVVDNTERRFIVQNNTAQILTFKTAAGTGIPVNPDTFIELLCDGTNVITVSQEIGVNQTWQDVSASRAVGVLYTNTTEYPIQLDILLTINAGGTVTYEIDGLVNTLTTGTQDFSFVVNNIIPVGATYKVTAAEGIPWWNELRS